MKHEIGAQGQWLLPRGRQERVVDDGQCSGSSTQRCEFLDVGDPQKRIARRLDPQQVGRLGKRGPHGCFVTEVDELDLSLSPLPPSIEQSVGSAVAIVRSDDSAAPGDQVADQGDRGHSRSGNDTTHTELQLSDRGSEQIARWISGTGVVVGALLAKTAKCEGRGEMNRRHDGARGIVAFQAGTNGLSNLAGAVAHETLSRATANIRRNCSVSFRKASWP